MNTLLRASGCRGSTKSIWRFAVASFSPRHLGAIRSTIWKAGAVIPTDVMILKNEICYIYFKFEPYKTTKENVKNKMI